MAAFNFSFYVNTDDQNKLQQVFDQLEQFDKNKEVKKAFDNAGSWIKYRAKNRVWTSLLRLGRSGYGKHRPARDIVYTLSNLTSNKRRSLRTYVGFNRKIDNGFANLAHIFDRGTKNRYTKRGEYRGHIFKVQSPSQGSMEWTKSVERFGPEVMKNRIIPTINNILTNITVH